MFDRFDHFIRADDGAVTVDWVVLTAGIVGLAMAVIYPIMTQSVDWGENLASLIQDEANK